MAVERHRGTDAEPPGVRDQALVPPAAADDIQTQAPAPGGPAARRRRARPRSVCAAPTSTARRCAVPVARGKRQGRRRSWRSTPLRTTAIREASTPRSTRSRADGSDTVTYWLLRCSRGESRDSTNHPNLRVHHAPSYRPLVAVAVMYQHHRAAGRRPGEPGRGCRSANRSPHPAGRRAAGPARRGPAPSPARPRCRPTAGHRRG